MRFENGLPLNELRMVDRVLLSPWLTTIPPSTPKNWEGTLREPVLLRYEGEFDKRYVWD